MRLWRRLLFYFRREQFERDLAEEMRLHVEMKREENVDSGMSPEDARRAAEREFGRTSRLMEESPESSPFGRSGCAPGSPPSPSSPSPSGSEPTPRYSPR